MGTLIRENTNGHGFVATAPRAERVKIILVEWAAYPLHRNKQVDNRVVRCGLGRMLEGLRRFDPGLPIDVTVIINAAGTQDAGELDHSLLGLDQHADGLRGQLARLLEKKRELALAWRMQAYSKLPEKYAFIEAVHFRDNEGQDF